MKVLVTNDDGYESPGIHQLAAAMAKDHDVMVVAPDRDMSGAGTGIGRFDPEVGVDLSPVSIDAPVDAYAIDGPPGLVVMAAALGAFGDPPDLVASGINPGINTGHSVIHSGTVGAALTARTFDGRGLAVSLVPSDPWHWETAALAARSAARWLLSGRSEPRVLNVNVPALDWDDLAGVHWADLDDFGYFRVANANEDKIQLEVGRPETDRSDPASDTALCMNGYITITPLATVEPAPFPEDAASSVICES